MSITVPNQKQPKHPSTEEQMNILQYKQLLEYYTVMKKNELLLHADESSKHNLTKTKELQK